MKREFKEKYEYGIYTSWPIFSWVKCCSCKKEFRRETLWRALTGPFCNGSGVWRYACTKCIPTKDEAHTYFAGDKYIKDLIGDPPTCRPAPPKGQSIINKQYNEENND